MVQSLNERFCGNCHHHAAYNYPSQVFCEHHYIHNGNPIRDTLDYCKDWKPMDDPCFCVKEAWRVKGTATFGFSLFG